MPGFFGVLSLKGAAVPNAAPALPEADRRLRRRLEGPGFWIQQDALGVFERDKPCLQADGLVLCADGVVLNLQALLQEHRAASLEELLRRLFEEQRLDILRGFRGGFSGVVRSRPGGAWHLYNDQLGTKPLFYCYDSARRRLLFGSELAKVADLMRAAGTRAVLDPEGARCLLGFGYMLGDLTLVEGVRRLPAGSILTVSESGVSIDNYFRLDNSPMAASDRNVLIEELHHRFQSAARDEYAKDAEYGYGHIAQLSGGLDSRMSLMSGLDAGARRPLVITCSPSGYDDALIAQRIARENGCDSLFFALDDGEFLTDVVGASTPGEGLVFFPGSAHILAMLNRLQFRGLGMMHTGMLGDGIMGSGLWLMKAGQRNCLLGANSQAHAHLAREVAERVAHQYENDELYVIYNRYINGVLNGFRTIQGFTEAVSTFMHVDVMAYALRIPASLRRGHRLYLDWLCRWVPRAADYRWEHTGWKPGASRWMVGLGHYQPRAVLRGLRRRVIGQRRLDTMSPQRFWYGSNPRIKDAWDRHYREGRAWLEAQGEIGTLAEAVFNHPEYAGKTHVLTLLAAAQILGLDGFTTDAAPSAQALALVH